MAIMTRQGFTQMAMLLQTDPHVSREIQYRQVKLLLLVVEDPNQYLRMMEQGAGVAGGSNSIIPQVTAIAAFVRRSMTDALASSSA